MNNHRHLLVLGLLILSGLLAAQEVHDYRHDLAWRLREPMLEARDVAAPLRLWFASQKATDDEQALQLLAAAIEKLAEPLPSLPSAEWPPPPSPTDLEPLEEVALPEMPSMRAEPELDLSQVRCRIVRFEVDDLTQYGVVLAPRVAGEYPLILYLHGAAFGVPTYSLPWLAELAAKGYVVAAPALRGEPLFAMPELVEVGHDYHSEGEIENLTGEVQDALAMVQAAYRLPEVKSGRFAMLGHSFGAGVGLLLAARTDEMACAISYDAWLVNPFRYYWDRLRGGANNWLSWEAYTEQPAEAQLAGLMQRSITHHAERVQAPLLLMIGGAYNGSVFHQSHDDLITALEAAEKPYHYEIIPGGGHNFVLYPSQAPARRARRLQQEWLQRYLPATPPSATPQSAP